MARQCNKKATDADSRNRLIEYRLTIMRSGQSLDWFETRTRFAQTQQKPQKRADKENCFKLIEKKFIGGKFV